VDEVVAWACVLPFPPDPSYDAMLQYWNLILQSLDTSGARATALLARRGERSETKTRDCDCALLLSLLPG